MIFVTTGSRAHQFDRLIVELDKIAIREDIKGRIVAQIGITNYKPKNFEYYVFLDSINYEKFQSEAKLIVSHGGTGALISALKKGKNVIAVPRQARYGEHIDDHQLQISDVLAKEGYLRQVIDIKNLENTIIEALNEPIVKVYDKPSMILSIIETFIEKNHD